MAFEQEAIVEEDILPSKAGRVKFRGTWWSARAENNGFIGKGQTVHVVDRISLTLIVQATGLK